MKKKGEEWTLDVVICSGEMCTMLKGVKVKLKDKSVVLPKVKAIF